MKAILKLIPFFSLSLFADQIQISQWNSEFLSSGGGVRQAKIVFTQATGTYQMSPNEIGKLTNVTYQEGPQKTNIKGNWQLGNQTGKFVFIVDVLSDKFTGEWTGTQSGNGWWVGTLISKNPDPVSTELKKGVKGPRTADEYVVRHANAVVKALKAFDKNCTTQLFAGGPAVIGTDLYRFFVNQKKNGVSKTLDTKVDSSMLPHDAAADVVSRLASLGSPCTFLTKEQVLKNSQDATVDAVKSAGKNLKDLEQASQDPTLKGKLNGPSVLVSNDEVIITDPMDAETQKQLIAQAQKGVQEKKVTNGPENLQPREQTFGVKDILEFRLRSNVLRPVATPTFLVTMGADMLFVGRSQAILSASATAFVDVELNRINLTAVLQAMTPQGFKTVKSIDEHKNTTWEKPEEIFLDNVVFFKYPTACTPTPVGPACIEGSLVGSAGIKPYGVTVNPTKLSDFQAYVRPYARVDIDVFGGLEYGVAHAGVRGQVAVLNGTLALLAGNVSEDTTNPCVRAEVDKLTYLDGRIYADVQADTFSDEDLDNFSDGVVEFCNNAKSLGAQAVDFGQNVADGLIEAGHEVGDTLQQGADKVADVGQDIVDTGKDTVGKATSTVSKALGGGGSSVPLVSFAPSATNFHNAASGLKQMDCEDVGKRVKELGAARYVKEIYNWEGITLKRHHKWYEACTQFNP
ncbi:hypothetical protein K2X33_11250 [bacterium]|nr:hypothetical protein [bacterium]